MKFTKKKRNRSIIAWCLACIMALTAMATSMPVTAAGTSQAAEVVYEVFAANELVYGETVSGNTVSDNTVSSNTIVGITQSENWEANLVTSENVDMKTSAGWHGSNGYSANNNESSSALYSTEAGGYAIFKVPMEEGKAVTKLIVNGRSCAGTSVSFSVSNEVDGTYTDVYTVKEATSGKDVELDVTKITGRWSDVYVKVTFPETACADWAALWNIRAIGTDAENVQIPEEEQKDTVITEAVTYEVFTANVCTYNANSGAVESTAQNEDWYANLVKAENASMQSSAGWYGTDGHSASNHETRSALYSDDKTVAGFAIFKVPMDEGAAITTLILNGRCEGNTPVSFSVSNEAEGTYTDVYTVTTATSGRDQEVDISDIAADWSEVYVRANFTVTACPDWSAVWNIRAVGTIEKPATIVKEEATYEVFASNDYTFNANTGAVESTSLNEDWNVNLVASENVSMSSSGGWHGTEGHSANNNISSNALFSNKDGGYAVFKVPMDENATITALILNGRYCAGTAVSFAISNAADGTYTDIYTVTEAESGTDKTIDITAIAADWSEIYVKAIFPQTICADWAALWNIRAAGTRLTVKTDESDETVEEMDPNPTDVLDTAVIHWEIGTADMDETFGLSSEGLSRTKITAEAGHVSEDYDIALLAPGKSMSFKIPAELGTETNLTMEIREIHKHGDNDIDYTVALNGEAVKERTVSPLSEGAIHVWVDFNKKHLQEENVVTITNNGEQEILFESIWFYENIEALMVEEDVYSPMEFVLFTLPVKYVDYKTDLETVLRYKEKYSGYNKYTIGMAFDIYYMNWEEELLFERLDHLMRLSAEADMPLYLNLNSWWSGTSGGMDGKGGFWKDITYQQIIYDPDNVNGRGVWQLTTPNMWSSTPWLSMNNEWYNNVRNEKLEKITDYIAMKQAEYAAEENDVDVHIFLENEPTYWAYKHYNSTTETGRADLSYTVIQAAAKEGFTLDPTDGLSTEEELWLFYNHTTYIEAEGEAVSEGLGNDAIVIVDGDVTYPSTQMTEKTYSHVQGGFEVFDGVTIPHWECHIVDNLRLGLEYSRPGSLSDLELQYVLARGTYADVNIERSAVSNFAVISQLYRYGADYAILFNIKESDYPLVEAQDSELSNIQDDVKSRTRSLWITKRADVERLFAEMNGTVTIESAKADYADAKKAYENGRYKTAYDLLMKVQSTASMPIDFAVSGTSLLLDYPVTIEAENAVNVTLYEVGETLKLKLTAENADNVKVTWNGVSSYTVRNLGDGVYEFTKGGSSSGAATLKADPYHEKDYPDAFEAAYKGSGDGYIYVSSQDAEIGEYVSQVTLKLADDCVITRALDGDESTRKEVEITELAAYDLVELKLNDADEVVEVKATYGETIGRVVSIKYPVVDGLVGLENPYITIRESDGTVREFEMCTLTGFDYPTMTGPSMKNSDLTDYGLAEGDKIKISYSPYIWGDTDAKALKVYKDDNNVTIIDEDFEDGDFGEYYIMENLYISDLDTNYSNQVVTAVDKESLGNLIWKITQDDDKAVRDVSIEYAARAIMGTSMRFYISEDDGETWTQIDEIGGVKDASNWKDTKTIFVDGIEVNSVLIKCEIDSIGKKDPDTWSSLERIMISIPSADLVEAQKVDALILAIGEVTKDSGDAIAAARAAYDALTDAQKQVVENDDILMEAEATYEKLMNPDAGDNEGGNGSGSGSEGGNGNEDGSGSEGGNGSEGGSGSEDGNGSEGGSGSEDKNGSEDSKDNSNTGSNSNNASNSNSGQGTNTESSNASASQTPNTGDTNNFAGYLILLTVCMIGIVSAIIYKRKTKLEK